MRSVVSSARSESTRRKVGLVAVPVLQWVLVLLSIARPAELSFTEARTEATLSSTGEAT
ncbi:hypothetical protein D3C72_597460 [compost metagenome]